MTYARAKTTIADAIPHTPTGGPRFKCAANGCNLAGTIFESSGQKQGACVYHYAASTNDWPKITAVLTEWECLSSEIDLCRSILTNPKTCSDHKTIDNEFRAAIARLEPIVETWWDDLKPQAGRGGRTDDYRSWCQRLERFLGGKVQAATCTPRRKAA